MNISFHGAAGEVTGSATLLETESTKILVDCGLFQGGDFAENRNEESFSFDPSLLTAVIITHAHLDHIGRLPLLIKGGYEGPVYATPPTVDLIKIVLEDAYSVMEYNNKKLGSPILYSLDDVNETVASLKSVDYYETTSIDDKGSGISFRFYEAGHVFGSAFIEMMVEGKKIVFSGDVGNVKVPILRDADKLPDSIDLLICESTYGDRLHETRFNRKDIIKKVIKDAVSRGGTILIPAFSVERTQEILYDLNELIDFDKVLPSNLPIFLDSPLAINATAIFNQHTKYFDEEAKKFLFTGDDLFHFKGLTVCYTADQSKKINSVRGQKIIIAGAGMMNGGRILHHALRYLSDPKTTLFFTGFQAPHTLGRRILEGESYVKIFREKVPVKCSIVYHDVMSAHADSARLLEWIKNNGSAPHAVCLNHGDPEQGEPLARKLTTEFGIKTSLANRKKTIEL